MADYQGAWQATRDRCHRLVYDDQGKPAGCPEPVTTLGWRADYQRRWYQVGACAQHAAELERRPRPR